MSDVKLTLGGAFEEEASRKFIDAWHRMAEARRIPSTNAIWPLKAGTLSPASSPASAWNCFAT